MKHLKYFESEEFKVGDIVKCTLDNNSKGILKKDEYYTVKKSNPNSIYINDHWWNKFRFKLATSQEIQAIKYNL